MNKRILILDTSVLCCRLQIPGKDEAGPVEDKWDFDRIDKLIAEELRQMSTLVLPVATLIETGIHTAQAADNRRFHRATIVSPDDVAEHSR